MVTLDTGLTWATWIIVGVLIMVLYRIARFYQITSGRRTYYRLFLVPLVLLFMAAMLNVVSDPANGLWRDAMLFVGGVSLIGLGYYLLQLMTGSRS